MDKINGEIKRVIGSGGADHCDRIDFKLYDRTGAAGYSDGFYYWSNPSDSRNDVLYTGGRDVDDTDGREDRNPDRTVKKAAGDHRVVFCTWIYHHNIGTGSAGAGRAGTFGIKYDTDSGGCRRSRNFSGGRCIAYVIFKTAVLYAVDLLSGGVHPDFFCIEGFSGDCI